MGNQVQVQLPGPHDFVVITGWPSSQHRVHRRVLTVSLAMVALLIPTALASTAQAVTPPSSVRLSGAYPRVLEGKLYPTTVTVSYPRAGYSASVSVAGPGTSQRCTPVIMNAARTSGKATCWRFAGAPGVATLRASLRMVRGTTVRTATSSPWNSTVTRRTSADVSTATYYRTYRCGNTTPYVWLTFDDLGSSAQVYSILATLKRNNVKAHMFPIGTWASAHPSLIAAMKRGGHIIDNHTWQHHRLTGISNAAVLTQINRGARPSTSVKLLRPPGGNGAFTPLLTRQAASRGYGLCYWTVTTGDVDGASAATIVNRVRYGDASTPAVQASGVVLMHFGARNTAGALQGVINAVRARSLRLQPLR